jgi:hypothetical protein
MVIDGAADGEDGDEYEAAQHFPGWYGPDGAERHMRADSIARSFQWIPGEATPWDRADAMARGLHRQRPVSHSNDPRIATGETRPIEVLMRSSIAIQRGERLSRDRL